VFPFSSFSVIPFILKIAFPPVTAFLFSSSMLVVIIVMLPMLDFIGFIVIVVFRGGFVAQLLFVLYDYFFYCGTCCSCGTLVL